MIGFNSIGAGSIGEVPVEGGTIIYAPSGAAITATAFDPATTSGKSEFAPVKTILVTATAPAIRSGVLISPPFDTVIVTAPVPHIEHSATENVPSAEVAVTSAEPFIASGKSEFSPVKTVSVASATPLITAGKSEKPTASVVSVAPLNPRIVQSATVTVPASVAGVASFVPQVLGGKFIDASNTINVDSIGGEIAEYAIGGTAIGEGEPSVKSIKKPPIIGISTVVPFVAAGKTVKPPANAVTLATQRPEIASRGRKLRILAIAS